GGAFAEPALPSGLPKGTAIAVAEATGDALMDVLVATAGAIGVVSFPDEGAPGKWTELVKLGSVPAEPGASRLLLADLDNNGAADLVLASGGETRVWLAGPGASFTALAAGLTLRALASADLDADGRLELVGTDKGGQGVVGRS